MRLFLAWPNPSFHRTCAKSRARPVNSNVRDRHVPLLPTYAAAQSENRVRHDTARFQSVSRFDHAPWFFAAARLLRPVAYRSGRCVSSCRRLTSADFFAVRRFVRFIQPAPNPALKRTCAKSRAGPLSSTLGISGCLSRSIE